MNPRIANGVRLTEMEMMMDTTEKNRSEHQPGIQPLQLQAYYDGELHDQEREDIAGHITEEDEERLSVLNELTQLIRFENKCAVEEAIGENHLEDGIPSAQLWDRIRAKTIATQNNTGNSSNNKALDKPASILQFKTRRKTWPIAVLSIGAIAAIVLIGLTFLPQNLMSPESQNNASDNLEFAADNAMSSSMNTTIATSPAETNPPPTKIIEKQRTILILNAASNHATPQVSYTANRAPVIWYNGKPQQPVSDTINIDNDNTLAGTQPVEQAVDQLLQEIDKNQQHNQPQPHAMQPAGKPSTPSGDNQITIF